MITGLPMVMSIVTIIFAGIALLSSTAYLIISNIICYYFEGQSNAPTSFLKWERALYAMLRGFFTCAIVWFVLTSLIVAMVV